MRKRIEPAEPWFRFVGEIDWFLHDCTYSSVEATLTAIRQRVIATKRVNDGQRYALDCIRERLSEGV